MSTQVSRMVTGGLVDARREPSGKRIRALLGDATVVDSVRAVLFWEPKRVVPSWAVPAEDIHAQLRPVTAGLEYATSAASGNELRMPSISSRPVLDPSVPFSVHTAGGTPMDLVVGGSVLPAAGLALDDPELPGYVELEFRAFDSWLEEDEVSVSHPRDPFHRIDVLASSRQVRLELDGELLAASGRPMLVFETMLPVRFYLPREDVVADLTPSPTRTFCAYKGEASYWSVSVGGTAVPDLAWSYPDPLREAQPVRDLIAFFDERVDVVLDGVRRERPVTPWSTRQ